MSRAGAVDTAVPVALDGFRIGRILGEGGAGTVYAATRDDGVEVAIKVLRHDLALTASEVARFLGEAEMLQRLAHPSIVSVLRSGRLADGRPYIVMPGLVGETLAARLRRGRMGLRDAIACFDQLADAVTTLHDAGIIHRDLKPDNVFLVDGSRVVLLDFGIAKDGDAAPSTTTTEGRVRGTPSYMAPERFFGAPASIRSDVYELAVCLYEMLAGTLPWADTIDVGARLDPAAGDLPPPVWSALRPALASTAERRPASVAELRAAVVAAAGSTPDAGERRTQTLANSAGAVSASRSVRIAVTVTRSRRATIALALGLAVIPIAVVVGLVIALSSDPDPAPPPPSCEQRMPRPLFCADFDSPEDFRAGFVNVGNTPDPGELGGGTIRVATDLARSGSHAAELSIPALDSPTSNASAALIGELDQPLRNALVTMNVHIDTEGFTADKAVAMIASLNFGPAGAINLSRKQTGTQLTIYDGTSVADKTVLAPQLTVGAWKTLKILIHNYPVTPDGKGEVIVFVDGLAGRLPLPRSLQAADLRARLNVGVVAARGPMQPFRIHIDDVAVTPLDPPPAS